MVVLHHILEESQPLFNDAIPRPLVLFGASGVDLFFVISGFIMDYTNHDRFGRGSASTDFFVRRIIRIVPLYWLCTLLIVVLHVVGGLYRHMDITPLSLVLSLLFLPNANIVLGMGWTLNYEMYFYVTLAVWLFASNRVGTAGVICSIAAIMALGWLLPASPARFFLTNPIALEFCFGFAVASAFTRGRLSTGWGRTALLFGLLALAAGSFGPSNGTAGLTPQVRIFFWGLPAVALLIAALSVGGADGRIGRCMLLIGDASYSLYLTHSFVMVGYATILKTGVAAAIPRPLLMLVPVAVSLAVGLGAYRLIEHPMNERLKLWWKQRGIVRPRRLVEPSASVATRR